MLTDTFSALTFLVDFLKQLIGYDHSVLLVDTLLGNVVTPYVWLSIVMFYQVVNLYTYPRIVVAEVPEARERALPNYAVGLLQVGGVTLWFLTEAIFPTGFATWVVSWTILAFSTLYLAWLTRRLATPLRLILRLFNIWLVLLVVSGLVGAHLLAFMIIPLYILYEIGLWASIRAATHTSRRGCRLAVRIVQTIAGLLSFGIILLYLINYIQ